MSWLIGRVTPGQAWAEDFATARARQDEVTELLRGLGLEPGQIMMGIAVTATDDGTFRLHFSRFVRGESGVVLDVARDQPASEPVVVDVEPGGWPDWLTGMNVPAMQL